jgi:hypothetical protein
LIVRVLHQSMDAKRHLQARVFNPFQRQSRHHVFGQTGKTMHTESSSTPRIVAPTYQ